MCPFKAYAEEAKAKIDRVTKSLLFIVNTLLSVKFTYLGLNSNSMNRMCQAYWVKLRRFTLYPLTNVRFNSLSNK